MIFLWKMDALLLVVKPLQATIGQDPPLPERDTTWLPSEDLQGLARVHSGQSLEGFQGYPTDLCLINIFYAPGQ